MEQNKKFKLVSSKKTRYLLPNILTLGGVCLGISSIKFSIDGNFSLAVTLILFAAILDALDGRIARLIKGTSEFGKELDSLTDFVSFGIAPVFILYFWELSTYGKLGWAIALIYSVCCVLRLARFNLTKVENQQDWKNNFFEGIPSPAGGILILMPLIYELTDFSFNFEPTKKNLIFIDTIYNPLETKTLRHLKEKDLKVFNGLDMFIYQGQKAFYLWNKINPEIDQKLIDILLSKLK